MVEQKTLANRVRIKRIYEPYDPADGKRILVDRLWPRGVAKEAALLDEWMRDVAPSPELRKRFNHQPERFAEFRALYEAELTEDPIHIEQVQRLRTFAAEETVTLLYAAKDPTCNHALVLLSVVLQAEEKEQIE